MCYLLLLLYSQVRYLWLWRSLFQLFRQISLLPMAGAFDRIPPRVAAKFGRFLRTSLQDDIDLEIPLQQCRLVLGQGCDARDEARCRFRKPFARRWPPRRRGSELERFEIVSDACVRPVVELAWPRRIAGARPTAARSPARPGSRPRSRPPSRRRPGGLDPATIRWLAMAEDLLALRIVYLVSQFAAPLRSMSAQLIYGPILLLLAVAWYPFHPQQLMSIVIWAFIAGGVLATLIVLVQIERQRLRQPGLPDRPQRVQARSDLHLEPAPLRRARRRLRADRVPLARLLAGLAARADRSGREVNPAPNPAGYAFTARE